MIAKLKSKPLKSACIEAELCQVTSSIRVSNITQRYEEDFIQMYFENPRKSGGGEVTSVELLGNGEAVVTFNDPKGKKLRYIMFLSGHLILFNNIHAVLNTTLKRTHGMFGRGAVVRREEPSEVGLHDPTSSTPSLTLASIPPLVIKEDPLITESLKRARKGLERCVQKLHVLVTVDASTGTIQVVPTKRTIANWQEECEKCLTAYIRSNYVRRERKVPKEAGSDIRNFLLSLPKEIPIAISFNREGTLMTTAGDCDIMDVFHRRVKEICSSYRRETTGFPEET